MSPLPRQIVLVLDVFGRVAEHEVIALLPEPRREARFHYLRDHVDAKALDALLPGSPIPFACVAAGVSALTRHARAASASVSDSIEWYVCGQAPLPLFALLGFELSAWAKPITVLNRRKDGAWDSLRIDEVQGSPSARVFETVGLDGVHEATGRVAVFVSVMGNEVPKASIHEYFRERGETLAGVVYLRTASAVLLSAENVGAAAQELAEAFSRLATAYPNALARGAAMFVAGPASLAFITGRGVNPTIVRETWIPNFVSGEYQDGVALPMPESAGRALDESADAMAARGEVWVVMRDALAALQQDLKPEHLCDAHRIVEPDLFLRGLRELRFPDDPSADAFTLKVLRRELKVGAQLLDALRWIDRENVRPVAQHLVIHELIHDFQDLTHANFRNVGRAAVALEEIDFWADAYTVGALARMRAETSGSPLHETITREVDHVLLGIEIFDRAEHGSHIVRLYERRLRRYLIWHLQRVRSATVQSDEQVATLLGSRLIVELVPLAGHLDTRYDKVVTGSLNDPELVIACGPRLKRLRKSADLELENLLDDIRHFRRASIQELMERALAQAADAVAKWATLH